MIIVLWEVKCGTEESDTTTTRGKYQKDKTSRETKDKQKTEEQCK